MQNTLKLDHLQYNDKILMSKTDYVCLCTQDKIVKKTSFGHKDCRNCQLLKYQEGSIF